LIKNGILFRRQLLTKLLNRLIENQFLFIILSLMSGMSIDRRPLISSYSFFFFFLLPPF
jgi:hypothetical protein